MNAQNIQFVDIYGVWYQPWWYSSWFYMTLIIFVCVLVFFVVYYLYRLGWFKKTISYDQLALQNLQKLLTQSYASDETIRAAYFQATMILKTYFAQRYNVVLHDKADLEIIPSLSSVLPQALQPVLLEFFQRAFQIKFAHAPVGELMLRDDIVFLKQVIEQTNRDFDTTGNS